MLIPANFRLACAAATTVVPLAAPHVALVNPDCNPSLNSTNTHPHRVLPVPAVITHLIGFTRASIDPRVTRSLVYSTPSVSLVALPHCLPSLVSVTTTHNDTDTTVFRCPRRHTVAARTCRHPVHIASRWSAAHSRYRHCGAMD